jgi:hypothetical protein
MVLRSIAAIDTPAVTARNARQGAAWSGDLTRFRQGPFRSSGPGSEDPSVFEATRAGAKILPTGGGDDEADGRDGCPGDGVCPELSFTRIDPRHIESDTRRNGEITVKRTFELSADGRTLTVIANGKSGGGRPYSNDTRVYEKQ